MSRIICSPGIYIQGKGEIKKLSSYYQQLGSKEAYLIVDSFIEKTYRDEIVSSFEKDKVKYRLETFGGECCDKEIQAHAERLEDADVVIGIGGGKTLDTAKATAHEGKLPVIIVPTAASTDAPCSRLSVIYTEEGAFDRYLFYPQNPQMVIADTEIMTKAPVRFLVAGIGDALATYYEAAACARSNVPVIEGGYPTRAALALAELCLNTLLEDGLKAKHAAANGYSNQAVENVVEANTYLSGIGFESGGLAAAHAIHNGLTIHKEAHESMHGELVAFGTLTQMVLENRPLSEIEEIIEFCSSVGLPLTLAGLKLDGLSDDELMKAAEASCAEGETIHNMPFEVCAEDVFTAMKTADSLAALYSD